MKFGNIDFQGFIKKVGVLLGITDLADVDFDSGTPEDNNVLTYDTASGKWKAEASAGGGLSNIVEDLTPQLGGDLDLNGKNIDFPTTPNISDCLDEDNMVSDSATKLATQQSIKAYSDAINTTLSNVKDAKFLIGDTSVDSDLDNEILSKDVNPTNLLTNGNFELWTAGTSVAPDGWVFTTDGDYAIAREGTTKKIGSYSAKLYGTTATYCQFYKNAMTDGARAGGTYTFSMWVHAVDGDVRLRVATNGTGGTNYYAYSTESDAWEYLSVTFSIPTDGTYARTYLYATGSPTVIYIDGAMLVEGSMPFAFSPKPLPRGGTITAEVDETKFSHKIPVMLGGSVYYIMLTQT